MIVAELQFRILSDTSFSTAEAAIRTYLESLIFYGQILGREFPTYLQQDSFVSRIVIPQQDALEGRNHSPRGQQALQALKEAGLAYPKLKVLGQDLMSNHTDPCRVHQGFILYCRFGQMNSVLYCLEHFAPVPLYQILPTSQLDHEDLIRWQLQYQALDEIQMQERRVLDKTPEQSMQQLHSQLNQQGRRLAAKIAQQQKLPVYYALYSGSSKDCKLEADKTCPSCKRQWRLPQPLHQLFDFQCQHCKLVSQIAWACQ